MIPYPKIPTVFLRDPATKCRTLLDGQYATRELAYLAEKVWQFTEKIDGMNVRVIWDGVRVRFAGKTDEAQMPMKLHDALAAMFTEQTMAAAFDRPACLYGEGVGPGIGANGHLYSPDRLGFILFDAMIARWWLERGNIEAIAAKLGCIIAPTNGLGCLADMVFKVKSGFQSAFGLFKAEGLVARPLVTLCDRAGNRIITKVKAKDLETRHEQAHKQAQVQNRRIQRVDGDTELGPVRRLHGGSVVPDTRRHGQGRGGSLDH